MAKKQKLVPLLPLREWFESRGLSDEKIAEKMGVDPTTVWRWRKGERGVKEEYRRRLAKMLEIEPDELYRRPGQPSIDAMLKNEPEAVKEMVRDIVKRLIERPDHE